MNKNPSPACYTAQKPSIFTEGIDIFSIACGLSRISNTPMCENMWATTKYVKKPSKLTCVTLFPDWRKSIEHTPNKVRPAFWRPYNCGYTQCRSIYDECEDGGMRISFHMLGPFSGLKRAMARRRRAHLFLDVCPVCVWKYNGHRGSCSGLQLFCQPINCKAVGNTPRRMRMPSISTCSRGIYTGTGVCNIGCPFGNFKIPLISVPSHAPSHIRSQIQDEQLNSL